MQSIEGADVIVDAIGAGQAHDRLDDRHNIARAMVDLFGQQDLTLFGAFSLGDIGSDAAEPDRGDRVSSKLAAAVPSTPTHFAIRPQNAEFRLEGINGLS